MDDAHREVCSNRPRKNRRWLLGACVTGLAISVAVMPSLAPASVEEQRARLPPPARCSDPVEGIWRAHKYDGRFGEWVIFTLTIRRRQPNSEQLIGTIENRTWSGLPDQSTPSGQCEGMFGVDAEVFQPADGTFSRGEVMFRGLSWRVQRVHCGRMGGYNLDRFSGTIDPNLQEFQSLNNDGGRDQNEPYVFRRIRCPDQPPPPLPTEGLAVPPNLRVRRRGCSR